MRRNLCNRTNSQKLDVWDGLISHLEQGYPVESYAAASKEEIEQLMIEDPDVYDISMIQQATRTGQQAWLRIGHKQATGRCTGSSQSWRYSMANLYGWTDSVKQDISSKGNISVSVIQYGSQGA